MAIEQSKATQAARTAASVQTATAARNGATYTQLLAGLNNADPRAFGPSSSSYKALANFKTYLTGLPPNGLVEQAEADKYLSQLGVMGSKQLIGAGQQLRQQELLLLMSKANPNIDQPLQVIKNLAAFGKANNEFDALSANTTLAALRKGADPTATASVIDAERSDFVNKQVGSLPTRPGQQSSGKAQEGAKSVSKSGKPTIYRNGRWEYQ